MSTATSKKAKTPKAKKTAALKAEKVTKAATKKEPTSRQDPRVDVLLSILIRNPNATHDDLIAALKAKGESMSASAVRLVRRGFVQTYRALMAAHLLTA